MAKKKLNSKKTTGNWNHPDCRYDDSPGKDNRRQVAGTYTDGKSYFAFCLREQPNGEYIMRGTVSLRSARNHNHVLKCKSEDGSEKSVSVPIRTRSCEEGEIKAKIVQVCTTLAAKNYDLIYQDLKSARPEDLTLATAIHLYGKDYLLDESRADPQKFDTMIRDMMRIALRLEQYHLAAIPVSALNRIKQEMGKSSDAIFSRLCKFIDWIGRKNYYRGINPIAEYYRRYPKKTPRPLEDILNTAFRPRSIPDDLAIRLRQKIADAPATDQKTTGLLLIYQAGLTAAAACDMHWGDIEFDTIRLCESSGTIKLIQKDNGATQDYTHPVFPFGREELRRRYQELIVKDRNLNKKKILAKMTPEQLTAYCRTELGRLGVPYADLTAAKGKGGMGGGVRLLLEDYANTLTHYCGIRSDAIVRFLLGQSLKSNVTADNYSSSSCPMGQERIQHYMERDTRFLPKPRKAPIVMQEKDGLKTVIVPPDDPQRFTMISLKLKLKKGEMIRLYSRQGLQVTTPKYRADKDDT